MASADQAERPPLELVSLLRQLRCVTSIAGRYRGRLVSPKASRYSLRVCDGILVEDCARVHISRSVVITAA